ncbi:kinase-like domain-containing protein [Gorgonomyces haynaldii]|nr:kinase-like domain-containing protein [Gorgonomyces haynaldii]
MNQAKQDTNSELISFYRGKRIGRGSYGTVYLVLNLHTFELMALKEVETSRFKNDNTLQEMEILQHLVHPNIVKYLGFESINGVSRLFMEYVSGGSLAATIARTGLFPEQLIRYITKQILSGLQYLHANNVIQRDIKADNILITRRGKVKISDFGVSVKDEHQDVYMRRKRTQYKGTANFMAPEAFGRDGYSAKADIWSLGCTVIEMATGGVPWKKQQSFVNIGRSIYNDHMYPPELETIESTETKQFVKKCLDFDPDTRPSALALLEDPFVMVEDSYPFKEFVDAAILRRQQERKADQRLVEITETSTSSHS